ncbi:MAG: hypothetical protein ACLTW9_17340 [Enterocloster sp.]
MPELARKLDSFNPADHFVRRKNVWMSSLRSEYLCGGVRTLKKIWVKSRATENQEIVKSLEMATSTAGASYVPLSERALAGKMPIPWALEFNAGDNYPRRMGSGNKPERMGPLCGQHADKIHPTWSAEQAHNPGREITLLDKAREA